MFKTGVPEDSFSGNLSKSLMPGDQEDTVIICHASKEEPNFLSDDKDGQEPRHSSAPYSTVLVLLQREMNELEHGPRMMPSAASEDPALRGKGGGWGARKSLPRLPVNL